MSEFPILLLTGPGLLQSFEECIREEIPNFAEYVHRPVMIGKCGVADIANNESKYWGHDPLWTAQHN